MFYTTLRSSGLMFYRKFSILTLFSLIVLGCIVRDRLPVMRLVPLLVLITSSGIVAPGLMNEKDLSEPLESIERVSPLPASL